MPLHINSHWKELYIIRYRSYKVRERAPVIKQSPMIKHLVNVGKKNCLLVQRDLWQSQIQTVNSLRHHKQQTINKRR